MASYREPTLNLTSSHTFYNLVEKYTASLKNTSVLLKNTALENIVKRRGVTALLKYNSDQIWPTCTVVLVCFFLLVYTRQGGSQLFLLINNTLDKEKEMKIDF